MFESVSDFLALLLDALWVVLWVMCIAAIAVSARRIAKKKQPLILNLSYFRRIVYVIIGCTASFALAVVVEHLHSEEWSMGSFYFMDAIILLSVMGGIGLVLWVFIKNPYKLENVAVFAFLIWLLLGWFSLAPVVENEIVSLLVGEITYVFAIFILFLPLSCYGKYIIAGAKVKAVEEAILHSANRNSEVSREDVGFCFHFAKTYLRFPAAKKAHEADFITGMYEYWDSAADKDNAPTVSHLIKGMLVPTIFLTLLVLPPGLTALILRIV